MPHYQFPRQWLYNNCRHYRQVGYKSSNYDSPHSLSRECWRLAVGPAANPSSSASPSGDATVSPEHSGWRPNRDQSDGAKKDKNGNLPHVNFRSSHSEQGAGMGSLLALGGQGG